MTERWLPVPEFEGYYEVSDLGSVCSLLRTVVCRNRTGSGFHTRTYPSKVLKANPDENGYPRVGLARGGSTLDTRVHRVVLLAFRGPAPDGLVGCHWDGNPSNNYLDNLYWGTHSDNSYDKVRHGRHHNKIKTMCKFGHPLAWPNLKPNTPPGTRYCLACSRGAARRSFYLRRFGLVRDQQTVSDECYRQIMNAARTSSAGVSLNNLVEVPS